MWLAPKLPAVVCVGAGVALLVALAGSQKALVGPFLRISLTAIGMGVFTNMVLSSLPPEGDSWKIPVQRALAPVILGAGSYWFLAGFFAVPEYDRARSALAGAFLGRRKAKAPSAEGGRKSK
jgi:hypothetical protein